MNRYSILKIDDTAVYLSRDGKIKKLNRSLFDFPIDLGDKVTYYKDGDIQVVLPFEEEPQLDLGDEKSVKSSLLQSILNLFLETLSIHNNDLGNLKKVFSQLLITLFMAWSLLGVIAIEVLLFVESFVVFIWKLLLRGLRALRIVDNGKKYRAYLKEKKERQLQEAILEEDLSEQDYQEQEDIDSEEIEDVSEEKTVKEVADSSIEEHTDEENHEKE